MKNKLFFSCLTTLVLLSQCGVQGKEMKESPNLENEFKEKKEEVAVEAAKGSIVEVNSPQADNSYGNVKIIEKEYNYTSKKQNCSIHITYPVVTQLNDKAVEQKLNQQIAADFGVNKSSSASTDCDNEEYISGIEKYTITKDGVLSIVIGSSWRGYGAGRSFGSVSTLNLDLRTGKKLQHQDLFEESRFEEFELFIYAFVEAKVDSLNSERYEQDSENYFPLQIDEVYGIESGDEFPLPAYSITNEGIILHFANDFDFDSEIFVPREQINWFLKKRN